MASSKTTEGSGPASPTTILPPPPPPISILPHELSSSTSTAASLASLLLHHPAAASLTAGYPTPWTFSWMAAAAAATYGYNNNNHPAMDLSVQQQHRNSLSIADLRLKAKRHAEELDAVSVSVGSVSPTVVDDNNKSSWCVSLVLKIHGNCAWICPSFCATIAFLNSCVYSCCDEKYRKWKSRMYERYYLTPTTKSQSENSSRHIAKQCQ